MAVGIPCLRASTLQQAPQGLLKRPRTTHRCFVQATQQVQAPQTQAIPAADQICTDTSITQQASRRFCTHPRECLPRFQGKHISIGCRPRIATVAVTGLGIAAAAIHHPPKVSNVLTAALGVVGAGVVSLSKWRDYAGRTTFNEEAMSFYQVGKGNIQSLLSEHQLLPKPAPILMRACTAARGLGHPQKGSPGVQYQSARTFLNRRKYSNNRCDCCTICL